LQANGDGEVVATTINQLETDSEMGGAHFVMGPLAVLNVKGYLEFALGMYVGGPEILKMWADERAKREASTISDAEKRMTMRKLGVRAYGARGLINRRSGRFSRPELIVQRGFTRNG
jgi:hypothetical protein